MKLEMIVFFFDEFVLYFIKKHRFQVPFSHFFFEGVPNQYQLRKLFVTKFLPKSSKSVSSI
mgnify:FL=1